MERKNDMSDTFLTNFSSLGEAKVVKTLLEANGIKSVIQGGVAYDSGDNQGIKIFVLEKDLIKAKELLNIQ